MANSERIEDIIDEKAFKQLERLLNDLGIAQNEFLKTAQAVETMNNNLSKVQSMKDLNTAMKDLETSSKKMQDAGDKAAATADKVAKAEDEVVKATKSRITADIESAKVLNTIKGTLDQNIQTQVRLKLELASVREEQKKLNSEYKTSEKVSDSLTSKSIALAKREAEIKAAMQESNAEIRQSIKEQKAAEGSSAQLATRLIRLRSAWDNLNASERENVEIGGVLQREISQLDEHIKELDASTGRHQRNVGNYQSALSGLPGPIGNIISSFEGMASGADEVSDNLANSQGGMSAFTAGLKSMAKAAWAFIATPIGATLAAVSAGLLAAKGWYEYNKGLVEATRLTKQLTGLTGADLKDFRSEVQTTADVFDKDFKEVLIATNAVAKQFGISQSEALDTVNKGFIAGADASGEFLEQLREYPAQLQAVGLTAQETTAIITQNVKEGIYSDKGIDAIKEAGLRIREMTPATKEAFTAIGLSSEEIQRGLEDGTLTMFEAIQKVSSKLQELPENSEAVGMALADIFGGPGEDAGVAYLKTLSDIDLNLDNVVSKTGEVGEAQLRQLEATEKLNKAWAGLFDSTGGTFELLIANAKLFGTEILLGIINGIIDLSNYFIDLYNTSATVRGSFELIGATFKNSYDIISFLLKSLLNAFTTVGKSIGAVFSGDIFEIGSIVSEGLTQLTEDAKTFGRDLAGNYVEAYNNTVKNATIEKIKIPTGSGGGAFDAGGTGSGGTGLPTTPTGGNGDAVIFTREVVENEIAAVERILEVSDSLGIETETWANKLAEVKMKLSKEATDYQVEQAELLAKSEKEKAEERIKYEEKVKDARQKLGEEIFELGVSIIDARFEQEKNRLQEEADLIDINKAKEIERVNQSVASEEEKANRIAIIEARANAQKEENDRKMRAAQEKQARFEKMASIARIIQATAQAIAVQLASAPLFPISGPLIPIIAAIGAAQIAQVMATPIPKYAKGTNSSKEGPAIVGEVGSEMVIDSKGNVAMTPAKPTLTWLEKGTKIIPNHEVKQMMFNDSISTVSNYQLPPQVDINRLVESYDRGTKELKKALNSRAENRTVIGKGGIHYMYRRGNSWKEYLNRNL